MGQANSAVINITDSFTENITNSAINVFQGNSSYTNVNQNISLVCTQPTSDNWPDNTPAEFKDQKLTETTSFYEQCFQKAANLSQNSDIEGFSKTC